MFQEHNTGEYRPCLLESTRGDIGQEAALILFGKLRVGGGSRIAGNKGRGYGNLNYTYWYKMLFIAHSLIGYLIVID